jgi:PAS domain S-box-containing protein
MPEHRDDDHVEASPPLEQVTQRAVAGTTASAWHRTADALQETERQYRELVEHSLGLICTHDLSGTILSVNHAAAASLGYQPEEGVGQNLRQFLSPDTRHLFDEYLERIQQNGQDTGVMRVIGRTGEPRYWMYRNVLSRDHVGTPYVLGHAIDITERILVEQTLRQSEEALRAAHAALESRVQEHTVALERTSDRLQTEMVERQRAEESRERALIEQRDTLAGLATFSDRLAPILTFEQLVDVLPNVPVPYLADWTMIHVLHDDGTLHCRPGVHADREREPLLALLATRAAVSTSSDCLIASVFASGTLMTSGSGDLAARLLGPGDAMPLLERLGTGSAAMIPLVVGSRAKAVLSLIAGKDDRFTTASALVAEDLARYIRLTLDRIQLYREAQNANRLKDEFLGTLSHELRTPLNAIFGWARILRMRELDKSTAHAVTVIERNAEAQLRLIEDVLDVSRIITGKMRLAMEPVDLPAVVRATIDALRPAVQAKGIRLVESIDPDLPGVVGDASRLQQVFWNLLSNAVKFTGADGVISVSLLAANGTVEFTITDTGVGIRRDILPFVFDRFRQADSSATRTHGGLGIGLAIVRHIVELHGGSVEADSPGEGNGATFTLTIPVANYHASAEGDRSAEAPPQAAVPSQQLRNRTVLVVEDHDDARELIIDVLQAAGASVISASSTAEAVDRVARLRPDLIVADIGLPDQDGYELLRQLRAVHGPELPAIALTAYARATDRERALAEGFQQHVVKPVDPNQLVTIIESVLRG